MMPNASVRHGDVPGTGPFAAAGLVLLALLGTIGGVWGGPALGDHEGLVAECARQMRLTGDWIVPRFLDTPFTRKPPLPYWLVAAASYAFPNDPQTGLPVTDVASRLPSAVAAFGTILLLWHLGSAMFGRYEGFLAALLAGSSVFFLLYGRNATAEMLLTFCCTWAYAHFWYAVNAPNAGRRRMHTILFYVALGVAMLAKGPAPLAMVAVPLAAWWYGERPLRLLARQRSTGWPRVVASFARGLWPRTRAAFGRLWLVPGLLVFAAVFVPWVWAVAVKHPHTWDLWNWQYWQRAQGNYDDSRPRGPFYYLKYIPAFLVPWLFLLFEGLAAPWMKRYARQRRALLFVGVWAAVGIVVLSLEPFKKPYYIAPAIPGLILMMSVVARRFFTLGSVPRLLAWTAWWILAAGAAAGLVAGYLWLRENAPALMVRSMVIGAVTCAAILIAAFLFNRGARAAPLWIMAVAAVAAFNAGWYLCAPLGDDLRKPAGIARVLEEKGVPSNARVLWMDGRPDSRLAFYFNRRSGYMITPEEIVTRMTDRTQSKMALQQLVIDRATQLLKAPDPVYLLLELDSYEKWNRWATVPGTVLATVPCDPKYPNKDVLIITNVRAGGS